MSQFLTKNILKFNIHPCWIQCIYIFLQKNESKSILLNIKRKNLSSLTLGLGEKTLPNVSNYVSVSPSYYDQWFTHSFPRVTLSRNFKQNPSLYKKTSISYGPSTPSAHRRISGFSSRSPLTSFVTTVLPSHTMKRTTRQKYAIYSNKNYKRERKIRRSKRSIKETPFEAFCPGELRNSNLISSLTKNFYTVKCRCRKAFVPKYKETFFRLDDLYLYQDILKDCFHKVFHPNSTYEELFHKKRPKKWTLPSFVSKDCSLLYLSKDIDTYIAGKNASTLIILYINWILFRFWKSFSRSLYALRP